MLMIQRGEFNADTSHKSASTVSSFGLSMGGMNEILNLQNKVLIK